MKTAVSIPDGVFEEADRLARRMQTSRSALYARALAEFIARHDTDQTTDRINRVLDDVGAVDGFAAAAARHTLEDSEW
jgi:predicted transcriptional regulator